MEAPVIERALPELWGLRWPHPRAGADLIQPRAPGLEAAHELTQAHRVCWLDPGLKDDDPVQMVSHQREGVCAGSGDWLQDLKPAALYHLTHRRGDKLPSLQTPQQGQAAFGAERQKIDSMCIVIARISWHWLAVASHHHLLDGVVGGYRAHAANVAEK
jgi:hypothetical protein